MAPTSSPELLAGRYRLGAVLGHGGMGTVLAAEDVRLERAVAVKLLQSDLAHEDDLRIRFEREARAAARISHPNVVAVYDTGEHDGVPFIVMERLPGGTLVDEFARGPLDATRVRTIGLEVLSALEVAHRLGVLHRDVKPGNILCTDDGRCKVADFGIAQIAEDHDRRTTGIVLGTVAYVAPERIAGAPATPGSDVYSLGVVLYEALAGRPPFRSDTPLGLVRAITEEEAEPLASLRPELDPALAAAVERSIARDPARRFASAAAMATALDGRGAARDAAPTVAVAASRRPAAGARTDVLPPATRPVTPRPVRRRWARAPELVVGSAIAIAVIVTLLVALLWPGTDSNPPRRSTGVTPSSTAVPAPLRRAFDDLDRAVQP